ncbi:dihydrofolate reductase [Mucilaginibacter antarcticus]|uniref:Dihydrofolate reductase n=1 Tax=Mucilaginibacter antarcticus TaxID=1855725 RepID=A0ABW5XML7_9SPHI
MTISIVVAIAHNNAIGKDNKLLWHLPKDLRHFKEITTGGTIIMGRKTYDSVGRPLPNRRNIIITRQQIEIPGCEVVNSLDAALGLCKNDTEVFIVGGAEIYKLAMPLTNRIFLTIVHQDFEADTFFPEIKGEIWKETERQDHEPDEKNPLPYSFITLERA